MIQEQAWIYDIVTWRAEGQTWDLIVEKTMTKYGIKVHRTTIQRWHDRAVALGQDSTDFGNNIEKNLLESELNIRLQKANKKIELYKSEASFFRKLYNNSTKGEAKDDILIDTIHDIAPSFKEVPKIPCSQH